MRFSSFGKLTNPSARDSNSAYVLARLSVCRNGTCRSSRRSQGPYARSDFSITYGAVRWKTYRREARSARCGMNWIALAPVPIAATRFPVRSAAWSHRAEWKAVPPKVFGKDGYAGRLSCPQAITSARAASSSPPVVRIRQSPGPSSKAASSTSVPNLGTIPYLSAQRRR